MQKPRQGSAVGLHHMLTYHMFTEASDDPQPGGDDKAAPEGAFDRPTTREVV